MKAVVLVGGFGTRLRPLTLTTPKQMLPIVNRPMIEYVIAALKDGGVTEVTLALGYKDDVFRAAYPDAVCCGLPIKYAVEPEPLDTAGAVRFAAESCEINETFVVVNGDVLTDLDLNSLWERHHETNALATIALTQVAEPWRYGVVPTSQGKVLGFVEKPSRDEIPTNWINAGSYVLEPQILKSINKGQRVSIERQIFPAIAAEGGLWAMQSAAYWIDIGTPANYLQAQLDLLDGVRGSATAAVSPKAAISKQADVERSVIAEGVAIAAGAVVRDSVIMRDVTIAEDVVVDTSVIAPRAQLGPGAKITGLSILGDDVIIAAGQLVAGSKIPMSD